MKREIIFTADGSPSVLDHGAGASFHSRHGAVQESDHIFIRQGLEHALSSFPGEINILEAGWGTGLNTLLTIRKLRSQKRKVRYTAVERDPLEQGIIEKLAEHYPCDSDEKDLFVQIHNSAWDEPVQLTRDFVLDKIKMDFTEFTASAPLHLVYYDAFAPAVNPEMWQPALFMRLSEAMLPDAVLVTFSASAALKRALKTAGFMVESLPGPPGKREMTRAIKT